MYNNNPTRVLTSEVRLSYCNLVAREQTTMIQLEHLNIQLLC